MKEEYNQCNISREEAVEEIHKACRQFAMLYFHFVKALVETVGIDKAKNLTQKAIYELSLERSNSLRDKAKDQRLEYTVENMKKVTDLPSLGWDISRGINHCPYAEQWMKYYSDYPWFKEFAPFYCDIIDTTNCENFTRDTSHKIKKNVLNGDDICDRTYFFSEDVKAGKYTYDIK